MPRLPLFSLDGNTTDCMLGEDRSEFVAEKFFRKVLEKGHSENPSIIDVGKHGPFPHTFITVQKEELTSSLSRLE